MDLDCAAFYFINANSCFKRNDKCKWIHARIIINVENNRYVLEMKTVIEKTNIEEEKLEKFQKKVKKVKLDGYKSCKLTKCEIFKNKPAFALVFISKLFSTAKTIFLAFFHEKMQLSWFEFLEMIFTDKQKNKVSFVNKYNTLLNSLEKDFIIKNTLYDKSLLSGQFIVNIIENEKSKEIGIEGAYILMIRETGLELLDTVNNKSIKFWELKSAVRFAIKANTFLMKLGENHDEGTGELCFLLDRINEFWEQLIICKDNYSKNRLNRVQISEKFGVSKINRINLSIISEESKDDISVVTDSDPYNRISSSLNVIDDIWERSLEVTNDERSLFTDDGEIIICKD